MAVTPSTPEQFRERQEYLRQQFGQDCPFHIPSSSAGSGPLDPETGRPMDPMLEGTTTYTDVTKRVTTVFRPIATRGLEDDVVTTALGLMNANSGILILNVGDYDDVKDSTHVTVFGKNHKITEFKPDGLSTIQRYLVYVERV